VHTMTDTTPAPAQADEYAILLASEIEAVRARAGDQFNLVEWAVGLLYELDEAEDRIKEMAKNHLTYLLSEVKGRRAGLIWRCGDEIRKDVDAAIAGKKRKSVTTATGRAGYRTAPGRTTLVIDEPAKVLAWAEVNCREAVIRSVNRAIVEAYMTATGEVPPGTHVEVTQPQEKFYIGPVTLTPELLPGGVPPEIRSQTADEFFGKTGVEKNGY